MKLGKPIQPFFAGLLPFFSEPLQGEAPLPGLTWWGALLVFFTVMLVVAWALIWNAGQEPEIPVQHEAEAENAEEHTPIEHG